MKQRNNYYLTDIVARGGSGRRAIISYAIYILYLNDNLQFVSKGNNQKPFHKFRNNLGKNIFYKNFLIYKMYSIRAYLVDKRIPRENTGLKFLGQAATITGYKQ